MIEIYVNNLDDPATVSKTVKELGNYSVDHADDVSCVYVHDDVCLDAFFERLDIIYVRGAHSGYEPVRLRQNLEE